MKVLVHSREGLCNRMRVINSCIALQKRSVSKPVNVEILWKADHLLNCDFFSLFDKISGIEVVKANKLAEYIALWNQRGKKNLLPPPPKCGCGY